MVKPKARSHAVFLCVHFYILCNLFGKLCNLLVPQVARLVARLQLGEVVSNPLVLFPGFVRDGVPVNGFHDIIGSPPAPGDDVLIRDSDCMKDGSRVMPQVMKADMRKPCRRHSLREPFGKPFGGTLDKPLIIRPVKGINFLQKELRDRDGAIG